MPDTNTAPDQITAAERTIGSVQSLIDRLRAGFALLPPEQREWSVIHAAVHTLTDMERGLLLAGMREVVLAAERIFSAITGCHPLIAPVADQGELINLLTALDPDKLSFETLMSLGELDSDYMPTALVDRINLGNGRAGRAGQAAA